MLARYSPVKGHLDLIEACRRVAADHPAVRFLVAGPDGQLGREAVERRVREVGLAERFAVDGLLGDPLETAAGFDLAVIASRGSEAVCRSALEYMALALPVVGTAVNVIPETIGEAGVIVPPEDPRSIADAIDGLIREPSRAAALGIAARARVTNRFDAMQIARRAAALVEEVRMVKERNLEGRRS